MGHMKIWAAGSWAITLAACAATAPGLYPGGAAMRGVADPHADPAQQSRLVDCNVPSYHRITPSRTPVRPGDQVELRHTFDFSAYGPQTIPLHCVDHWRIDPPEAATLSADRRTLNVSRGAVPDSAITVTVTANGYARTVVLPVLHDTEPDTR